MPGSYPSPSALLHRHGLRAKKSWGQNFLGDEAILDDLARLAIDAPGDRVVELGAGLGHLTARLLARGGRVVAVERDRDLAAVLRAELGDRIDLREADAARLDWTELAGGAPLVVIGNLPYHLTSPILFSMLDAEAPIARAVLLLQREVAERLAAPPGSASWGLLSVLLQQRAWVTVERQVPRSAFLPPPKVESAVVRIAFGSERVAVADPATFRRVVKAGFAQRRKVLANALAGAGLGEPAALARALDAAGIDPRRRGETLTVQEWATLAEEVSRETSLRAEER